MADPVVAADGKTYDRDSIEEWMKTHNISPLTNKPFIHKFLTPNDAIRDLIAKWCEQNGVPVPVAPKREAEEVVAGGGVAEAALLQKPQVMCSAHPKEQLRVFCQDCDHAVCVLCAVDVKRCKKHATEALDTLIAELEAERQEWAGAQEECRRGAEQLCLHIQADADAKKRTIDTEAAALQQQVHSPAPKLNTDILYLKLVQVRAAADERAAALGAIVQKREEREELVAGAAASPQIAVKGSPATAVVACALNRAKGRIPPASAAEFVPAAAPAAAVGHLVLAPTVLDPEDAAAIAAAAQAAAAEAAAAAQAAAVAALGDLLGGALLQRVTDRNKVQQFGALMRTRLAGKRFRLLYTWSRDGRSNASFHQRCDNQVRALQPTFGFRVLLRNAVMQGPTLVVVRSTTGHTFGGYANAPWASGGTYTSVGGCFLFLVENPHNDPPSCFECSNKTYAMRCGANYGPTFGGGHDIGVHSNGDAGQSYTSFPSSYTDTLGRANATFTGAKDFTVEDYEVWGVN